MSDISEHMTHLLICTTSNEVLQHGHMFHIEVEIVVWRILENCVLVDLIQLPDVRIHFLPQQVLVVVDQAHDGVIHQDQHAAALVPGVSLLDQEYHNQEEETGEIHD